MSRRPAVALALAVVTMTAAPAARAGEPGAEGFLFSRLAGDARSAALGGAAAAVAEGLSAAGANPAGVALRSERAFGNTVAAWPLGFVGDTVAGEWPAGEGGIAASLAILHHAALPVTTDIRPGGTGGLAAVFGGELSLLASQWLSETRAFGLALRVLHEELGERRTEAVAADFGGVWRATPDWTAGAAVRGLGRVIREAATRDPFPLTVVAGARYELPEWPARVYAAAEFAPSGTSGGAVGLEGGELFGFAARGALVLREATGAGFTGGLGFRGALWTFDYAFTPVAELGGAHRLTFAVRWGGA